MTAGTLRRRVAFGMLAGGALLLLAGCATVTQPGQASARKPRNAVLAQHDLREREAVERFERQRNDAEFQVALTRFQDGDDEGCREALEHLLNRTPGHREARLLLVELHLIENRLAPAMDEIAAVLAEHPDDAQSHYSMGLVLDAMGRPEEALAHYRQATERDPENEHYAVGHRLAADAGSAAVRLASAVSSGRPAAALPAGYAEVQGDEVDAMMDRGRAALAARSCDEALFHFEQAAAARPDDPRIPVAAAAEALRSNRPDLAVELLEPALVRFPRSAVIRRASAAAHYRLGDYSSSQVLLQQSLSLDNADGLAYFLMGCTLAKLGQSEAAESHFRQARALDPRFAAQP